MDAESFEQLINAGEFGPPPEEQAAPPTLDTITAADLQKKDIPPIKFIVEKLIPIGLNILASPPKYGKSWMVLALCLAVAIGGRFLGYSTNKCGCLYLALEDSQRRLKSRMNKLLSGRTAPSGFHFATASHDMDNGLFDELEGFLEKHPDTGLIVIDTLQRVRGATHGKEGAYAADYREVGALKAFADKHNVAVLLVHHLRKMKDDGDPFNMISGTNGIMGAADTTMVLTKEKRGDENATFSAIGRDIESSDTILRFNKDTCYWENLGDADWFAEQQARREYQEIAGAAIGAATTAVGAFAKSAVEAGSSFDSSMSQVAATMGKTTSEIGDLRDFAMEMGANTAFSATQAADALNYMALAGYDSQQAMEALPNVLNLAAAGGMDLALASDMVTDAQSALGLTMDESARLVDKMAMASSKSNTSVAQLGEAILTVGGTAKNLAGGTTELSAALGILADNGVKGAEGGTALRNIILSLSAPTDKAAKSMKELGVEVFDAEGNMRPLNETFADLDAALSTMTQGEQTQVLSEIFNKVDLDSVYLS